MLNKVILMGRLTADPEVRQTPNGISVLSFSIAVDRNYSKAEKKTDFINLVAWRQTAEFIGRFFTKGQMIAVEGSIQTRNYEDKTGAKRTAFEVVVDPVSYTHLGRPQSSSHMHLLGRYRSLLGWRAVR